MSYDFSDAADFLENEVCKTPEQFYKEVCIALNDLGRMERAKSKETRDECLWNIYHTMLTCADFFERITVEED